MDDFVDWIKVFPDVRDVGRRVELMMPHKSRDFGYNDQFITGELYIDDWDQDTPLFRVKSLVDVSFVDCEKWRFVE